MIPRTKIEIENERKELKKELFDLKHPRNELGKFIENASAEIINIYWRRRWGKKYGIDSEERR